MTQIQLLIGNCTEGTFKGFIAQFEGEELASYEEDLDGLTVHTLYKCPVNGSQLYRVYTSNEEDRQAPRYDLRPYIEGSYLRSDRPADYTFYRPEEIIEHWPLFATHVNWLRVYDIDL